MSKAVRILLGCTFIFGHSLFAATYYVDYSSGNDSNPGTSKSSPWQNAPGMRSCSGVCSKTTINAGDSIILKGGVTWPNASFMWSLPGGSASSPVYVGVDKTWYAGGAWSRPILSAGGAVITNNFNTMFSVPSNITMDNFEITGFYWTSAACSGAPYGSCGIFNAGQSSGQTWENLYIHGWSHAGTSAVTSNGVINIFSLGGWYTNTAHDNVIVGTDVLGDHSVNVFFNGPSVAYNNYIKQVSSAAIISYPSSFHDNHVEDIGPAYCNMPFPQYAGACTHENGFEDNGDLGLNFYNNVITNVSAGLALWVAPNPGSTAYMWNNVIYNIHDNQVLDMAYPVYNSSHCSSGQSSQSYCNTGGSFVFWNNTVQCGDNSTLYDVCQSGVGNAGFTSTDYENNHFIANSTASGCKSGAATCTFAASNVVQTLATANAQGYTSSGTFAFAPTSSSGATVSAGTNLTTSAVGSLSSLISDTTYACFNGSADAVACPGRTSASRPTTGSWSAGAYALGGSNSLEPPTNVRAVAQ